MRMSATSGDSTDPEPPLTLHLDESGNLVGEDARDATTLERFYARKRLRIRTLVEKDDLNRQLTDAAIELARDSIVTGKRIVVFVRSPEGAIAIADLIRKHVIESVDASEPKPKMIKSTPFADCVEVLTGTMRGLERDELVDKSVFKDRWLNGNLDPAHPMNQQPVFLVSTSAGEVGFDLNADHLVGDAAPLDSWIQRLGRVRRRGKGTAIVEVLVESAAKTTKEGSSAKHTIASASIKAIEMLRQLPAAGPLDIDKRPGPILDASPHALGNLPKPEEALSPSPATVELTDILLDAWSITSITEPMPGRPAVGPWLRGIDEELPQTTIAWRAELDEPAFADLDVEDIEEWFDSHRILTHETLSVPTHVAAKWFVNRWSKLADEQQSQLVNRPIIVDRVGMTLTTVKSLIDRLSAKGSDNASAIRNAELILPASFGGIERGEGLLDAKGPVKPQDSAGADNAETRLIAPDVADLAPGRTRSREIITITEEGQQEGRSIGGMQARRVLSRFVSNWSPTMIGPSASSVYTLRREKPEYGSQKQTLKQHVGAVRTAIDHILSRLSLPKEGEQAITRAAQLAADYHDHGKNRGRWERLVGGKTTPPGQDWLEHTLGKSDGEMKRDPRGYRHEFGSLREFTDAFKAGKLLDEDGTPISQDVFDLAMHLIATHHGRGRPHFPKGGFDPDCEAQSDEIHTDVIRRFARLQRKYGWWYLAWLENLLRFADALASTQHDDENQDDEAEAGQ